MREAWKVSFTEGALLASILYLASSLLNTFLDLAHRLLWVGGLVAWASSSCILRAVRYPIKGMLLILGLDFR